MSPFGLSSLAWPLLGPPGHGVPSSPADAFCRAMLPMTSRTFALSIEALPDDLSRAVRVAYLLCRTVDTFEDDPLLPWSERAALFDEFAALLSDDDRNPETLERASERLASGADALLCRNATAVFQCFRELPEGTRQRIRPHVLEMTAGMREYAERTATEGRLELRDLEDLERYCYYVAGTVGGLLTALFLDAVPLHGARLDTVRTNAVSFGLGLQLVNIVKDVAADASRGVSFVPRRLADSHGVPLERLLDPALRPRGLAIIAELCARARHHLRCAEEYTLAWPAREGLEVRRFCVVPLALALASLDEVEYGDDTLRAGRVPKVSKTTVFAILGGSAISIDSDLKLRAFLRVAGSRHGLRTAIAAARSGAAAFAASAPVVCAWDGRAPRACAAPPGEDDSTEGPAESSSAEGPAAPSSDGPASATPHDHTAASDACAHALPRATKPDRRRRRMPREGTSSAERGRESPLPPR